jgi:hypothetical protein
MIEGLSATMKPDSQWGCHTSQYTYRMTLLLSLVVSGIILAIQFPIFIYSPDGSFHAAKILRVSEGDFFTDPFTGVSTIYPSLFHFFFGLLNRALELNSIQMFQLITLVNFFGLFSAFYYFVAAFFNKAEEASLCTLFLSLVIYAPTSHYILLPQPSNFSFVFLLFSIGALYRYVMNPSAVYLILGGVLGSLAVNIWWSNGFSIFSIIVVLAYYSLTSGSVPRFSHIAMFIFALLIPCLYTAWHFCNIWDVLPYYLSGTSRHKTVSDVLTSWIVTFMTKGNLPFMHHMNLWDLSITPKGSTANLLADGFRRLHSLASIVHYFVLVLPFNLLLVAYACAILLRKDNLTPFRCSLIRTLAIGGFAVLLSSSVMLFYVDVGHLRRVHFVIYIMFLLFAFTTVPVLIPSAKLRKLSLYISIASLFSLAYTVTYSPRPFTGSLPESDNEIVRFVSSIPNRNHQRIFMLGEGLQRVAPFVTLQSFVEAREGRYYFQDPKTASELYREFRIMKEKTPEWQNVARERNIKWVILRTSEATELEVFKQYANHGVLRCKNRDWAVLELSL